MDRVVNALAAHTRFGGPAVVVDFGTCTNFDVVGADGAFLGGVLAPGDRHRRRCARRAGGATPRSRTGPFASCDRQEHRRVPASRDGRWLRRPGRWCGRADPGRPGATGHRGRRHGRACAARGRGVPDRHAPRAAPHAARAAREHTNVDSPPCHSSKGPRDERHPVYGREAAGRDLLGPARRRRSPGGQLLRRRRLFPARRQAGCRGPQGGHRIDRRPRLQAPDDRGDRGRGRRRRAAGGGGCGDVRRALARRDGHLGGARRACAHPAHRGHRHAVLLRPLGIRGTSSS